MQFLTNLLGGSENTYVTMALALGIVLVLIVLGLWALKLVFRATNAAALGRNRRLSVVDTLPLDPKRQLVIVRRDNVEHVLLIGGAQDVLVESGIPVAPRAERPTRAPAPAARSASVPASPQRVERRRPVGPESAPQTVNDLPPPVPGSAQRPVTQIRDFPRPGEPRRAPSLRHTALLRPVSTLDPGIVRLAPEKSAGPAADSARSEASGRVGGGGERAGGTFAGEQEQWRN